LPPKITSLSPPVSTVSIPLGGHAGAVPSSACNCPRSTSTPANPLLTGGGGATAAISIHAAAVLEVVGYETPCPGRAPSIRSTASRPSRERTSYVRPAVASDATNGSDDRLRTHSQHAARHRSSDRRQSSDAVARSRRRPTDRNGGFM
jgi:hypothetical protein